MNNEMKSETIRLSVIDDHPIIFLGVQLALRQNKTQPIEFVNQYNSGTEVLLDMENLNSNVLLIDLCLHDIMGFELAKKILEVYPEMKIGIYSNMLDRESILNSFKSGVLGYLHKSANSAEIIDFVLTISRGERYVRGIIADIIFENEHFVEKQKQLNITKREFEILQLIIDGLKNREIAESLNISERTVEFHKQNIYLKLGVTNSVDLYKTAMRLNLMAKKNSIF